MSGKQATWKRRTGGGKFRVRWFDSARYGDQVVLGVLTGTGAEVADD